MSEDRKTILALLDKVDDVALRRILSYLMHHEHEVSVRVDNSDVQAGDAGSGWTGEPR